MNTVEEIIAKWKAEGVKLNPPASATMLSMLQDLGITLPPDVRAFYQAADGMPDFEHDPRHLSFWSVSRILKEHPVFAPVEAATVREVAFGDFLIDSHFYVFRITREGTLSVGHDVDPSDERPSLESFFRRYIDDPESQPVVLAPVAQRGGLT